MPIHTVIHEKRKELGLTQEQVAVYLGVTAPAVNKWEKGTTYPDITLLPALARLLKVDLNTLLCFEEGLSRQEIFHFSHEAAKRIQSDGLEAGFKMMVQKIREYPHCAELIHSFALLLDSSLIMSELTEEEKKIYENTLLSWYRRVADSDEEDLKSRAAFMLASKYMHRKEFGQAQEMIDLLPEHQMLDKNTVQADLYLLQGKEEELQDALKLLQKKLLSVGMEMYGILIRMVKTELAAGSEQRAEQIVKTIRKIVEALELWDYYTYMSPLDIALARKNIPESITCIKALLDCVFHPWNMKDTRLYDRIGVPADPSLAARMLPPLLAQLEQSPEYEFLRKDEEFQKLTERYRAKLQLLNTGVSSPS